MMLPRLALSHPLTQMVLTASSYPSTALRENRERNGSNRGVSEPRAVATGPRSSPPRPIDPVATAPGSDYIVLPTSLLVFHALIQPGPRNFPFAFDRRGRDVQDFRGLLNRQTGEVSQLNYAALLRVELFQFSQRLVEFNQVVIVLNRNGGRIVQGNFF